MSELTDLMRETAKENLELKKTLRVYREALGFYGQHLASCNVPDPANPDAICDCGFEEALSHSAVGGKTK